MPHNPLLQRTLFHVGPIDVTRGVVTTWFIIAILAAASALATRRLALRPTRTQAALEALVVTLDDQIRGVTRRDSAPLLPLLGALFVFITVANLSGLLPGVEAPTAHLETPAALGVVVYFATHYHGIRTRGVWNYLRGYVEPTPILLPLNILAEITRTFSLMIRLFGNVMSGGFITALVLSVAGLVLPIPLMALEIVTGVLQAYIFTILATVFVGAAIGAGEKG